MSETLITKLKTLTRDQEKEIFESFNECLEYLIDIGNGEFIAVHLKDESKYNILEHRGDWYYGSYRE